MEVLLMTEFAALITAVTLAVLGVLEKLLGAVKAFLELRRSNKEHASLQKAHETNRPKHLKE
jgi:hypothetical protein